MYRYLYPEGDFLFLLKYEYVENNINQERFYFINLFSSKFMRYFNQYNHNV